MMAAGEQSISQIERDLDIRQSRSTNGSGAIG